MTNMTNRMETSTMDQARDEMRERGREELRATVAVLSATYECTAGTLSQDQWSAIVAGTATELFPEEPFNMVLPLSWMGLRLAQLYAVATGRTVPDVLAELGAEAVTAPCDPQ